MPGKKSFPTVEEIFADHPRLDEDLDALVKAGCERAQLLTALELAFLTDVSWEGPVGRDRLAFKGIIRAIKDCADRIEELDRTRLIYDATISLQLPAFIGLREGPMLAKGLREYSDKLERLPHLLDPKRKLWLHAWKAHVVALVIEATHKPHDREVSALISAIRNDAQYSEKAHQKWRLENSALIDIRREKLRERRSNPVPPPSPPPPR